MSKKNKFKSKEKEKDKTEKDTGKLVQTSIFDSKKASNSFSFKKEETIEKVYNHITKDDLELFKSLLEVESVDGKEHLVRPIIENELKKLGFKTSTDKKGNLSGIRGESSEYAALNAHMDIVGLWSGYSSYGYSSKGVISTSPKQYSTTDLSKSQKASGYSYSNYDYDYNYGLGYENTYSSLEAYGYDPFEKLEYMRTCIEDNMELILSLKPDELMDEGYTCMDCDNMCTKLDTFSSKLCSEFKLNLHKEDTREAVYQYLVNCGFVDSYESFFGGGFYNSLPISREDTKYEVLVNTVTDKITGKGKRRVLGGDDKCGIFISLMVAKYLPDLPLKVLFTTGEETGCTGVRHFINNNLEWFNDIKYCLTIDRRLGNQLLWSQCGKRSCDNEFAAKLAYEGIKQGIPVVLENGTVADVIEIREIVPNAVNMSAGYYNPHDEDEYIVISDVDNIIGWVMNIVTNV